MFAYLLVVWCAILLLIPLIPFDFYCLGLMMMGFNFIVIAFARCLGLVKLAKLGAPALKFVPLRQNSNPLRQNSILLRNFPPKAYEQLKLIYFVILTIHNKGVTHTIPTQRGRISQFAIQ